MGNIMTVVFFFPAKQMLLLHESSRLSEGLTRRPFSLSYCGYKNSHCTLTGENEVGVDLVLIQPFLL